jgi:hypothetical protein
MLRDTFSDTDYKGNFGFNAFHDGRSSDRRGDKNCRSGRAGLLNTLGEGAKDRQTQMRLASLFRVGTTNKLSVVLEGLLSVKSALFSGKALKKNLGVGVDL